MSISFTQSMQSLHADHGRASLWGLSLTSFFLALWLIWFFTPSLTVYANGHLVKMTRRGTLVAEVPAQVGARLQAGQTAQIYPQGATTPSPKLTATVLEIAPQLRGDQIQVILYPNDDAAVEAYFAEGVSGEVQVAVETISPAVLLLRTSEQGGTAPSPS